jgi:prepilin-type N-terminal cleavage/methylation domain-containing protein
MKEKCRARRRNEKGFSLLEMVIASAILLVGVLSVVQLVPTSLKSNLYNRMDTMATVVAQRELDQMVNQLQPCSPQAFAQTFAQNPNACRALLVSSFTDKNGNIVNLGGSSGWSGASVVMQGSTPIINFAAATVTGYNIEGYQDPYDPNFPNSPQFELRWAVYTVLNNGIPVSKRIIIGCRETNAAQPMIPVNLDTSVQR